MAIVISRRGAMYEAKITPPHGTWHTARPLDPVQLSNELLRIGCHQTDIGDAFFAADPDWLGASLGGQKHEL